MCQMISYAGMQNASDREVENTDVSYIPGRKQQRTKYPFFAVFAEGQRARNLPGGEWVVKIL